MQYVVKILGFLFLISGTGIFTVNAQVFQDTALNFENPGDLILKSRSGTKGISIADYNQDGYLDIYFVIKEEALKADASSWNRLFQFDGQVYRDKTSLAGAGAKGFTELVNSHYNYKLGASWGDYNNDGYPDLFLANSGRDILLRHEGDGTFTDITTIAGVAGRDKIISTQGLWFDYDLDGDLDLYVSVQADMDSDSDNKENLMYENLGNDQFKNVSIESGLNDSGNTWTSLAFDVNGDGHLDLYVANDFGPNTLYISNGDKTFSERTAEYGLEDNGYGMGLALGDPNLDGLIDMYLTNVTEEDNIPGNFNRLFLNTPDRIFVKSEFAKNVSEAGWGWGTDFFDFDNDGDEDLIVANGFLDSGSQFNRLFRNNISSTDDLIFEEFTDSSGFEIKTQSFVNAVFDQNNDGFLDVLSSNIYQKPLFYLNSNKKGNWIKIWLEGVETNRNGFGSVIKLETEDRQYYRYYHGAGLHTQHILPIHFGLGDQQVINKISIYWLNGHVDVLDQIQSNQTIRVKEFEGLVNTSALIEPSINPERIRLIGNYPNPFNGVTNIAFELTKPTQIKFSIYNSIGQLVHTTVIKYNAGNHHYSWNPGHLNSGVYMYRITDEEGNTKTSCMLYLK
jgi:hypothetical protein